MNHSELKALRINAGLTQKELASRIGVSKDAITSIETGRLSPSDTTIAKIRIATTSRNEALKIWAEWSAKREKEMSEIMARVHPLSVEDKIRMRNSGWRKAVKEGTAAND